ncbi:MAG TPA: FMN-binding negative transcriptional regulator [Micropepsaceae bacterium]|nr:FMN-binding negative transcriptional regulator [Micropepsaceae bacterium]
MYNPSHFAVTDIGAVHAMIRENVFATFAAVIEGEIHFAYLPVLLDEDVKPFGSVHFHCARANPLATIEDGTMLKMSIMGAHCYISPDWYESKDQVPTWNYTAVEGTGRAKRLSDEETLSYLAKFAFQQEKTLVPKPPWGLEKVDPKRLLQLSKGITGFELAFDQLEGKTKLSQNRAQADIRGAIAALKERGDPASVAVALAMQKTSLR